MADETSQAASDDRQLDPDPLAPVRLRYADWLELDPDRVLDDREEDPAQIRAMQLILRLERHRTPSWHAALRLAAGGAARLCLDPRVASDPLWNHAIADYAGRHIRKVTRRARGAQWEATADLAGITVREGDQVREGDAVGDEIPAQEGIGVSPTEVRVLLPGLTSALDKRVAKLQVGGTDAPVDAEPAGPIGDDVLAVWIPPEPVMTLGKTMAQAGHAGMIAAALLVADNPELLRSWFDAGCPVDVRRADEQLWKQLSSAVTSPSTGWHDERLLAVRDAGFTEIAPGTVTVIARAPLTSRVGPVS